MFCKNCGKEIPDNSIACTNCGAPTGNVEDTGSLGWCLLGCCIPMAGLILYFVWKDQKPKTAKKCIIGFLCKSWNFNYFSYFKYFSRFYIIFIYKFNRL